MSEEPPPSDVLGSLPRTRPHRRSEKRAERPGIEATPSTDSTPGAPGGDETVSRSERHESGDLLAGAVRTAAELAELGLSTGARTLRAVVARLPRP